MSTFQLPFRLPQKRRSSSRRSSGKRSRTSSAGRLDKASSGRPHSSRRNSSSSRSVGRRRASSNGSREDASSGFDVSSSDGESPGADQQPDPWTVCPPHEAKASMPPGLAEQYETAGLDYHEPLPRGRFPHAAFEQRDDRFRYRTKLTKRQLRKELLKVNPPPAGSNLVDGTDLTAEPESLKQRSTAVLTKIMHLCLERRDYARAGRAFGILLRLRINDRPLDLRGDGTWGIGAEILMHRDRPRQPPPEIPRSFPEPSSRSRKSSRPPGQVFRYRFDNSDAEREAQKAKELRDEAQIKIDEEERRLPMPSPDAWSAVKEYYEHLIVQYPPSKKPQPGRASAPEFYVAMYEVWIAHLQDLYHIETDNLKKHYGHSFHAESDLESGRDSDDEETEVSDSASASIDDEHRAELSHALDDARAHQLGRAEELAKAMDAVLGTFPYSDDFRLVGMRANVSLWMADLCISAEAVRALQRSSASAATERRKEEDDLMSTSTHSGSDNDASHNHGETGSRYTGVFKHEEEDAVARREMNLEKARNYFDRAEELRKKAGYARGLE